MTNLFQTSKFDTKYIQKMKSSIFVSVVSNITPFDWKKEQNHEIFGFSKATKEFLNLRLKGNCLAFEIIHPTPKIRFQTPEKLVKSTFKAGFNTTHFIVFHRNSGYTIN